MLINSKYNWNNLRSEDSSHSPHDTDSRASGSPKKKDKKVEVFSVLNYLEERLTFGTIDCMPLVFDVAYEKCLNIEHMFVAHSYDFSVEKHHKLVKFCQLVTCRISSSFCSNENFVGTQAQKGTIACCEYSKIAKCCVICFKSWRKYQWWWRLVRDINLFFHFPSTFLKSFRLWFTDPEGTVKISSSVFLYYLFFPVFFVLRLTVASFFRNIAA